MMNVLEGTPSTSSETSKTYKLVRVERDGSFIHASEDELNEVEHLLADPRNDKGFMDGVLCLDLENAGKGLTMDDFQGSVDCSQIKLNGGVLDSDTNLDGGEDSKYEFLDGMLHGVKEGDLLVSDDLANTCNDFLLDGEFSDKVADLDYGPCEGSDLGNLGLDSNCSLDMRYRDKNVVETLKSSTAIVVELESACDQNEFSTATVVVPESACDQNEFALQKMTIRELQEAFRSTFGRNTSVKDKQWLKRHITCGLQDLTEFDNVSCLSESGNYSNEGEGNMFCRSGDGFPLRIHRPSMSMPDIKTRPVYLEMEEMLPDRKVSVTSVLEVGSGAPGNLNMENRLGGGSLLQKRQRKPTRRYIEESSFLKPRSCGGRLELSITSSRDKRMLAKSHKRKAFGSTPLLYQQDSFDGSGIQAPFGLHVCKRRPKEETSTSEHDSEEYQYGFGSSPSESQDETSDDSVTRRRNGKGGGRRKHHRLWTLSEVMKLIDGVSQYGVGRWTEIKRLLFSSSAYRTSVDLKDKWRNLLRASGAQVKSKRQVEQGRKQATCPIPLAVLRRVNELAIIFPYPRERKSKFVNASEPVATPVASSPSTGPSNRCGRVTRQHRKNLA
ncbi:hypothetical protein Sjap_013819 [Stephania japonica]|uniref:Uncharacterized protein n=1 Tax=Stephania japonica TaxID=461633 RepID=A0AAP0J0M8_9MAGN